MRQTGLHGWHVARGANMTDFNGWHMPLYYAGMTAEHLATRKGAGLFDLGHMGRVFLHGPGAREFVDYLTPARLREAKAGDVLYSFLLNERGCPIDDITVYVMEESLMLVVNAGNHDAALGWIEAQCAGREGVTVEDRSYTWGMIAIQGPEARGIADAVLGAPSEPLDYYTFRMLTEGDFAGGIVSATGYTGEDGYEIYLPDEQVVAAWERLVAAGEGKGLVPVGLGARDSLRLEACMPLYGHELNETVNPIEAGLGKFLDFEKDFIGRAALESVKEAGPSRRLVAFRITGKAPVPRQGFGVCDAEGGVIGEVTSGVFSPSLQVSVGLAFVGAGQAKAGTAICIDIRGRKWPAVVAKKPLYKRSA